MDDIIQLDERRSGDMTKDDVQSVGEIRAEDLVYVHTAAGSAP